MERIHFTDIEPKTAKAIFNDSLRSALKGVIREDDYLLRLPRIEGVDGLEIGSFHKCDELREELEQRRISGKQISAITKTLGLFCGKGVTVGKLRRMPDSEVLEINVMRENRIDGIGIRRLLILRLLFGYEEDKLFALD